MRFEELNLEDQLMAGIRDAGFVECTEVQAEVLPHTLAGRDVAVQSQTGTGKTAAFLISTFQLLSTHEKYKNRRVLMVAPTRELAVQIEEEAKLLGKHMPFRVGCFYGGVGYNKQEALLADGVEIVVGTPGRLIDFNRSKKLDFQEMGIVVIDEADRLFDMGFYPDIRLMMRRMVPREERMTMLFSATLGTRVRNLAWEYMDNPVEVEIRPETVTVEKIDQIVYHVSRDEKMSLLLGILEREQPENVLIFTNTKRAAEEVAKRLDINGYPARYVMGDLPQSKRLHLINELKAGKLKYLVATDVAARGLHVEGLAMVINYDLPEDPESYVHRIGRTARVGREGRAVSLADEYYVFSLEAIEQFIGRKIPSAGVTDDLLARDESRGTRITLDRYEKGKPVGPRGGRSARPSGAPRHPGTPRRSGPPRNTGTPHHAGPEAGRPDSRAGGDGPKEGHKHHARPAGAPKKPAHSPRRSSGPRERPTEAKTGAGRNDSLEDRLAHYRQKYGESFSPDAETRAREGSRSGDDKRVRDTASGRGPAEKVSAEKGPAEKGRGDKGTGGASPTDSPQRRETRSEQKEPTEGRGILGRLRRLFQKNSDQT